MPDYVKRALEQGNLMDAYLARPPYQRNDYLGWITEAKREETRLKRLDRMLDELARGDVYMKMPYGRGGRSEERAARGGGRSSVDEYLERLPEGERAVLEKLRKAIKAAAPGAEESIGYGMPVYKHHGPLVGFAAFKNHLSFFVMSPGVMEVHREALEAFDTTKGAIRFRADRPPSAELVRSLVKARLAENEARGRR